MFKIHIAEKGSHKDRIVIMLNDIMLKNEPATYEVSLTYDGLQAKLNLHSDPGNVVVVNNTDFNYSFSYTPVVHYYGFVLLEHLSKYKAFIQAQATKTTIYGDDNINKLLNVILDYVIVAMEECKTMVDRF